MAGATKPKATAKPKPADSASKAGSTSNAGSVDADLRELVRLLPSVLQRLKRGSPGTVPEPFREAFGDGRLGPRHMPVVMTVTLFGPLGVSEIAERIGLSVGTASLMVGELDRAGVLERSEDEKDRRRTIVALPEGYRQAMDEWLEERVQPLRRGLERMSAGQRRHFMEGWRLLEEEAERVPVSSEGC